jgi:hypothetical protein
MLASAPGLIGSPQPSELLAGDAVLVPVESAVVPHRVLYRRLLRLNVASAAISGGFDFASRTREPEPVRPPRPIPEPPVRPRIYPRDRRARLEAPVAASTSLPSFQPIALNQHRNAQAQRPGVLPDDLAIHLPPPQIVRHPTYSSSAVSSTTYPRIAPGIYTFKAIGKLLTYHPVRRRRAEAAC